MEAVEGMPCRTGLFDGVVSLVNALLAYGGSSDATMAVLQVGAGKKAGRQVHTPYIHPIYTLCVCVCARACVCVCACVCLARAVVAPVWFCVCVCMCVLSVEC